MIRRSLARERAQNVGNASIVAECFTDMAEAVHIARTENEACAELERIFAKFVLAVAFRVGAFARGGVRATQ